MSAKRLFLWGYWLLFIVIVYILVFDMDKYFNPGDDVNHLGLMFLLSFLFISVLIYLSIEPQRDLGKSLIHVRNTSVELSAIL
jgi:hypothetical protein